MSIRARDVCVQDPSQVASRIEDDTNAALRLEARGTPTVVVNGTLLGRVPSAEELEVLLRRAKRRR